MTRCRRPYATTIRLVSCLAAAVLLLLCTIPTTTHAQIFQHFFGGGAGQAFEQREQEAPPSGDAQWFDDRVQAATCAKYLCPRTLSCVDKPAHCPCPFTQQIRCSYPNSESGNFEEGGFACVQEPNCDRFNQLRRLGQNFKLSDMK